MVVESEWYDSISRSTQRPGGSAGSQRTVSLPRPWYEAGRNSPSYGSTHGTGSGSVSGAAIGTCGGTGSGRGSGTSGAAGAGAGRGGT